MDGRCHKQHGECDQKHEAGDEGGFDLLADRETGVVGKQHHGEHGSRSGDGWNGNRKHRQLARRRIPAGGLIGGVRVSQNHLHRKEKEDDAAGHLEGHQVDSQRLQQDLSADDEKQDHRIGNQHGLDGHRALEFRRETGGDADKDRDHADRLDHHPQKHKLIEQAVIVLQHPSPSLLYS